MKLSDRRMDRHPTALAALAALGALGTTLSGCVEPASEEVVGEVEESPGKDDSDVTWPFGTWRTDAALGFELDLLVLKTDRTFHANVVCEGPAPEEDLDPGMASGCFAPPGPLDGTFKFTRRGGKRFLKLMSGDETLVRYAWSYGEGGELRLDVLFPYAELVFDLERDAEHAFCAEATDCERQALEGAGWSCVEAACVGGGPALPTDAELARLTEEAVYFYLTFSDEGTVCEPRDFQYLGATPTYDAAGRLSSIVARSQAEGQYDYCAGYTDYECETELVAEDGGWREWDTSCEVIGQAG